MGAAARCLVALFFFVAAGCAQDPRVSRVFVKDIALVEPTQQAIDFWYTAAPGQLDTKISTCDLGDYQCISINWENLEGRDGVCRSHYYYDYRGEIRVSSIGVDVDIRDDANQVRRIISHELGHAFSLNHVDAAGDLMYYKAGPCITDASSAEWFFRFGEPLKSVCVPEDQEPLVF